MEISLTKNLERKKKEQTKGRTYRRMLICNPTIQLVVVDLYTKYEVSTLNGCEDIFDEKFGKKNKEQTKGRTNRRMPICNPTIQLVVVDLYTKYEVSILNGCEDIFDEKFGKNNKEQTKGRTNRRMPICNPTIQLVVVDLYTKYEVFILNGCEDIFDEKVLRNYGRTDGRMDGTTDRCKPVYPQLFQSGGITKLPRKKEYNEELCHAQDIVSYAQGQGHNHVKGQIVP